MPSVSTHPDISSIRYLELVGAAARYPSLRALASRSTADELNQHFKLDLRQHEVPVVAQLSDEEIAQYKEADERRFEDVIPYGV